MEAEMEKLKMEEKMNEDINSPERNKREGKLSSADERSDNVAEDTNNENISNLENESEEAISKESEPNREDLSDTNNVERSSQTESAAEQGGGDKTSSGSEGNKTLGIKDSQAFELQKNKKSNSNMREIEIEKIILHCGGTEDKLDKSTRLLEKITGSKKIFIVQSKKRYPAFGIAPGKKSGCKITIRDKEKIKDLLTRFFESFDNEISKKQIVENQFCFGVHEYIEVPGLEYERDLGILGFEVMVVFTRKGKRVKLRKVKQGSYPKKQEVTKEEIVEYLIKNYGLEVKGK